MCSSDSLLIINGYQIIPESIYYFYFFVLMIYYFW